MQVSTIVHLVRADGSRSRVSKTIATLAILLIAAVTASPESHGESASDSGVYLAAGGGGALYTPTGRAADAGHRLSFGFVGRGEVGYRAGDVRVGAQGSYTLIPSVVLDEESVLARTDIKLQVSMIGIMLTGWYDVPTGSALIPYVGGGVGVVLLTATSSRGSTKVSASDTTIGAQAGLGVNVRLSSSVDLQVGYRILARTFSPALEMYHHAEAGVVYRL